MRGQEPGLEQVLVRVPVPEREQVPVPGLVQGQEQVPALELGLRALVQAAQAWVPDRGRERVRGALGLVALKGQTALGLVMEPALVVSVRQTALALARETAPVRAGMDQAPAANNSTHPVP